GTPRRARRRAGNEGRGDEPDTGSEETWSPGIVDRRAARVATRRGGVRASGDGRAREPAAHLGPGGHTPFPRRHARLRGNTRTGRPSLH
ncbi:MAG: hypothetical protein AVDCRST_MAG87-2096, partial [uncultured Thermomicrobiales bacterium]